MRSSWQEDGDRLPPMCLLWNFLHVFPKHLVLAAIWNRLGWISRSFLPPVLPKWQFLYFQIETEMIVFADYFLHMVQHIHWDLWFLGLLLVVFFPSFIKVLAQGPLQYGLQSINLQPFALTLPEKLYFYISFPWCLECLLSFPLFSLTSSTKRCEFLPKQKLS